MAIGRGVSGATVQMLVSLKDEASQQLAGVTQNVEASAKRMQRAGLAVAGVGMAMGAALLTVGRRAAQVGQELRAAAGQANLSIEEYQRLGFVVTQTQGDLESVVKAMNRLTKASADANRGLATQQRAFEELGIEFTNMDGSLRSSMDLFLDMADRFASGQLSAEKAAAALDILGVRGGPKLFNTLKLGRQGILDLMNAAKGVIPEETVIKLEKLNSKVAAMNLELRKAMVEGIQPLIPEFERLIRFIGRLAERFSNLSPEVKGFIARGAMLTSVVLVLGGALMFLAGALKSLAVIKAAVVGFKAFAASVGAASLALLKFLAGAHLIVVACGSIAYALGQIAKGIGQLFRNEFMKILGQEWIDTGWRHMKFGLVAMIQDAAKEMKHLFRGIAEAAETELKIPELEFGDIDVPKIELDPAVEKAAGKMSQTFGYALREIIGAYEHIPEWMQVQSRAAGPELRPIVPDEERNHALIKQADLQREAEKTISGVKLVAVNAESWARRQAENIGGQILGAAEQIRGRMVPELSPLPITPALAGAAVSSGMKQVNLQFNYASRRELHERIDRELDREGL